MPTYTISSSDPRVRSAAQYNEVLWYTFEAPDDRSAWYKGRDLVSCEWGKGTDYLLTLSRLEQYRSPRVCMAPGYNPSTVSVPDGSVYVTVAVGTHGAPWAEEPSEDLLRLREFLAKRGVAEEVYFMGFRLKPLLESLTAEEMLKLLSHVRDWHVPHFDP